MLTFKVCNTKSDILSTRKLCQPSADILCGRPPDFWPFEFSFGVRSQCEMDCARRI